jgi:hypothetical protein
MPDRKTYIGSGDAIDLMMGRWHDVWLKKTGRKQDEDLSGVFRVQLGSFTEPFHVSWLHDMLVADETVGPEIKNGLWMQHPNVPYIGGTPDAHFGNRGGNGWIPVEVKHTGGSKTMAQLIEFYMPQLQHHLLVTGAPALIFSAILGNDGPNHVWIGASEEWEERLLQDYARFWSYVEADQSPGAPALVLEASGPPPKTDSVPINGMTAVDMSGSNQFAAFAADYLDNEDAAKAFDRAKKELKAMVGPTHRKVYGHGLAMTKDARGAVRFSRLEPAEA